MAGSQGTSPVLHRVVVLGTGAMGRLHARVFSELGELFALEGVYDANPAAAAEVGRAFGVPRFDSEGDAMARADLVVIASPIAAHAGAASRALAAGKHVLVEKPLSARAAEAYALVRATRTDQRLFVGHSERFNPVICALVGLVRPSDVLFVHLVRVTTPLPRPREHGVLVSLGVHDLDLVSYLTRSAIALREVTDEPSGPRLSRLLDAPSAAIGVHDEDRAELLVTAASGATARIVVDRLSGKRARTITLTTAKDVFFGDLLEGKLARRCRRTGRTSDVEVGVVEPLVAQARAIAKELDRCDAPSPRSRRARGFESAVATGIDGARALAVAERASERLSSSRPAANLSLSLRA